jgi:hypothetical protein
VVTCHCWQCQDRRVARVRRMLAGALVAAAMTVVFGLMLMARGGR